MPYRYTQFQPDEYYHLYNRGNNYESIFFERENYLYFLRLIRKYLIDTTLDIISYCLLPNHYHLLIHLNADNLSDTMQRFALAYSKTINKRFKRVGSLYQGPFKAIHVNKFEYLLHLTRYIHMNPVNANLVEQPEDWKFSSYPEYIGTRNGTLPKPDIILSQFSSRNDYRLFVEDYNTENLVKIEHLLLDKNPHNMKL